jgi:hypothetical protein
MGRSFDRRQPFTPALDQNYSRIAAQAQERRAVIPERGLDSFGQPSREEFLH